MPKVYTYNAEFNPISFADRIAPMRLYKEEYDKQQAAYEKLLEETNDLSVLKDVAMDANSYSTYENFTNDIASVADEMRTKGLSQDVRNKLLDLKRRQSTEISPLLDKQKKRAELIAEQRKYRETHQNALFDTDYDEVSLDNITGDSTFRPYDLDDDLDKTAKMIYSNIMSNNGVDSTDYDKVRSQLGYDNLSPKKQAVIDNMIGLARTTAASTYQIYKDKEAMDRYRYSNRRTSGTSSGTVSSGGAGSVTSIEQVLSGKKSGKYRLPSIGNLAIEVDVDKSGNVTVNGIDKNAHTINGKRKEGENDEQYFDRISKELFKAYYGHDYYDRKTLNNGSQVLILVDRKDGKTQHYIVNNKGKIVPVPNINEGTLLQEYDGKIYGYTTPKDFNRQPKLNAERKMGAGFQFDEKKHELDKAHAVDIMTVSEMSNSGIPISTSFLNSLGITGEDINSALSDFFNNGYKIIEIPIVSKKDKDKIVGYDYTTALVSKARDMDE